MKPLYSVSLQTDFGPKNIEVFCSDIADFDENIDVLTVSAFMKSYYPSPRTMIKALYDVGISVQSLSMEPFIDLRKNCHTWLSEQITGSDKNIARIGCVELVDLETELSYDTACEIEQSMINSMRAYFSMLDTACIYDVKMETVALPVLGSGCQHIASDLIIVPLLNECITFLKRNSEVKRICFIEKSQKKADMIADYIKESLNLTAQGCGSSECMDENEETVAFISYASEDKNIADNLCFKLEQKGLTVWYAPRDVKGAYAESIALAIDKSYFFIIILSQNSMKSQHVLNEIDLAFQALPNKIKFKPLRMDASDFTPSFKYYLSRQHWMDAVVPPLEERLNEFVENLLLDI